MKAIKKLKDGKTTGGNEIPAEVWKYGGVWMQNWVWRVCGRISKRKGWIEDWYEKIIVPILKKGEGNRRI